MPENKESTNSNSELKQEQDPFRVIINTSTEVGKSIGRMEAFLEASRIILGSTTKISNMISNPDEAIKVITALVDLSTEVAGKT